MSLRNKIASRLNDFNDDGLPIMVDGERLYHKRVQVRANKAGEVFIHRSGHDPEYLDDNEFMALITKATKDLRAVCTKTNIPFKYEFEDMHVQADSSLNLVILQSDYYHYVNESLKHNVGVISDGISNYLTLRNGVVMDEAFYRDVDTILQAARPIFLWKYANFFFYSRTQPTRELRKSQTFYNNSQEMFVPVFIETRLYPTLTQLYPFLENTMLYQMAVEKGRKVACAEKYNAYMLTQKEMCKALGLRKFIRMKPEQWARVFLGAVLPVAEPGSILYRKFPNETDKIYRATTHNDFFNSEMTPEVYTRMYEEYKNQDLRSTLEDYRVMSTLAAYCYKISEYVKNQRLVWDEPEYLQASGIYSILAQIDVKYKGEA